MSAIQKTIISIAVISVVTVSCKLYVDNHDAPQHRFNVGDCVRIDELEHLESWEQERIQIIKILEVGKRSYHGV